MTSRDPFLSAKHVGVAIDTLASEMAALRYETLPAAVRERLTPVLVDLFGVTVAGMRTPELEAMVHAWACPPGSAPVIGTSVRTVPETAAYLSAVAACCLELDEGNKYAAGHPAAHVVFAAVAAAQTAGRPITGPEFLTAVAAGYEVAARFGHAVHRDPRWHTHGHWGATGAACASALILGGSSDQVAAAIDSATGLMHVTPWATVLSGDFTRNLWLAGANMAGLHAARLALAGLTHNAGSAEYSLGSIVGTLDPAVLVEDLGSRWLTTQGYLKQHSSCSYTHTAIDLVQSLRTQRDWQPDEISRVRVTTNSLATSLLGRDTSSRLAAMFSLPFVVSTAMVNHSVDPATMEPGTARFRAAEAFMERVDVSVDTSMDAWLPDRRCTEVSIEFTDGEHLALAAPNPIGDADHFPFTAGDIARKLTALIGSDVTTHIQQSVRALATAPSATEALGALCG